MKMETAIVFVGSTHGFLDDVSKQKEIINAIKPEFVLSENLENIILDSKEKFKRLFKSRKISDMTSFEEVEDLVKFCFEKRIKLIGIDMFNFGFKKEIQKKIKNQKRLSDEEQSEINDLVLSRERIHLAKINEYRSKTLKPLVVIVGCWHLRHDSLLRKDLNNYKIIAPSNKDNQILFEPQKREIKYIEIFSDDFKK